MKSEVRFTDVTPEQGRMRGYAVLWGKSAFIPQLGRRERFTKGSLKIPKQGVSCYFQHKKHKLLGNSKANTLRLKEDDKGLYFECDLPESQTDVREACKRGDVQGASIAFFAKEQDLRDGIRTVTDAELSEISLVSTPCHESPVTYRAKGKPRPKVKWSKLLWEY